MITLSLYLFRERSNLSLYPVVIHNFFCRHDDGLAQDEFKPLKCKVFHLTFCYRITFTNQRLETYIHLFCVRGLSEKFVDTGE